MSLAVNIEEYKCIPWIGFSPPSVDEQGIDSPRKLVVMWLSACSAGDPVGFLGGEDPLEKETAAHSSILAWKIPWMEEPGGLHNPWGPKESDTTERLHFHFKWLDSKQFLETKQGF